LNNGGKQLNTSYAGKEVILLKCRNKASPVARQLEMQRQSFVESAYAIAVHSLFLRTGTLEKDIPCEVKRDIYKECAELISRKTNLF